VKIFFVGSDAKATKLVRALEESGVQAEALASLPFLAWRKFVRGCGRRGDVVVVRYLNDNASFLVTVAKPFGDLLSILVLRLRGLRVFWICHNVDRETESFWPLVSNIRRWLWSSAAERILVTDVSLMPAAQVLLRKARDKLVPMSVGLLSKRRRFEKPELENQARTFLRAEDGKPGRPLRILCAGVSGPKYLHFDLLPQLEAVLRETGWAPRIVVITRFQKGGTWSRGKHYDDFIAWCERTPTVMLIRRFIDIDEREWAPDVDLIWRAMGDYSFLFTLLNACRAHIPILSYQSGLVGDLVEREGIGASIAWDFSNVDDAVRRALNVDMRDLDAFLARRSWDRGAQILHAAARHDTLMLKNHSVAPSGETVEQSCLK